MTKNDAVERAIKNIAELAEKAPACHPALLEGKDEQDNFMAFYKEAVTFFKDAEAVKTLQALQTSRPDAEILDSPELLEKLAAIEHARWARWYIWQQTNDTPGNRARWGVQAITLYSGLTEREKESDRKEVREYLEVIRAALKSGDKGRWQKIDENTPIDKDLWMGAYAECGNWRMDLAVKAANGIIWNWSWGVQPTHWMMPELPPTSEGV